MKRYDNFRPWWVYEQPQPTRRKAIFTAIAGYVTTALIGIGLSATVAGIAANLIVAAAFLGLSALLSPRPPVMKTPQAQSVLNQSIGPRIRGYGRVLLGGTRAFFESRDGYLYQAILMHSGEIDAIERIDIGDATVSLNGSGDVTSDAFTYRVKTKTYPQPVYETRYALTVAQFLGSASQGASGLLTGAFGAWTAAHRLRGIAYLVARFRSPPQEDFQKIFPEGSNTPVRGLCRLSKVYDPRNGQTAWAENASLCILDYVTHPDGFRKSRDDVDLPSFAAFANLCDQNVPRAGGGTEKRYRLNGVYQLTDEPEDILRKMRATCDAELYQNAAGKIAIRGGKWEAPTVVITERDILGHSLEQGNDRFAAFNELKITYTSPQHRYQSVEATPWSDLADQDERGVLPSELDLDFVPSPAQARRLAKIHIAKSNPRWKGRIRTNLVGLNALGQRTIQVILPELEINDAFFVAGFSIDPELKYVDIEIMTISEAAYTWNAATEESANPAVPADTTPDLTYPVPQNLTLTAVGNTIEAAVTDIGRDDLELQVQIQSGAGGLWQEMETVSKTEAVFSPNPPALYQGRSRWVGPQNVVGEWSFPLAVLDTQTPVPAPVEVMTDFSGTSVEVSWRNPNFAQFNRARVWRAPAGGIFADAVEINMQYGSPNSVYYFVDTPGTGSWRYWVTAVSNTNGSSSPALALPDPVTVS